MPATKVLPSEMRRRKARSIFKKYIERDYGKVTGELFGKCIGMKKSAAQEKLEDPGDLKLWQIWELDARWHFSEEEINEIMGR